MKPTMFSERILRKPEIRRRTGLSDSTIWRFERAGDFPRRRRIGRNSVGWLEGEVARWIADRATSGPAESALEELHDSSAVESTSDDASQASLTRHNAGDSPFQND
jgi:prophage regulatory protein